MPDLLTTLETYYDTVPRSGAVVHEVGPFTVFTRAVPADHPYYARPRLGLTDPVSAVEVAEVRAVLRDLDAPEALEWVHETTPSLLDAARDAGLAVEECPLLVLRRAVDVPEVAGVTVRMLGPDDDITGADAAVNAGFSGTDQLGPRSAGTRPERMRDGLLAMAGAYEDGGAPVGGGSHSPRGGTTELAGIGVLPRARRRGIGAALTATLVADARARGVGTVFLSAQDDTVARIYESVGFARVGTACIAGVA